ncbi:MAG: DUF4433 domain-containing protein [Candidatus Aminicenantes bacterium]|nr:MAG: DUF4433 domain-containing protein [Candidatus Aminicenantes bacterium]
MTKICHITDKKNFLPILQHKGLYSKNKAKSSNISYINIAYEGIQERRADTIVPISPYGTLHDYVPFYFAPCSPMLYAIKSGIITGYRGGQEDIIYLVSDIESIAANEIPFVFTDGHAIMAFSNFYNQLNDLMKIDWKIMNEKYWADTQEDNDRKRRRQAEFLIKDFLPLHLISEIGVMTTDIQNELKTVAFKCGYDKIVHVKRKWYY